MNYYKMSTLPIFMCSRCLLLQQKLSTTCVAVLCTGRHHPCRRLATVPSRGPDAKVTGQCGVKDGSHEAGCTRRVVPLSPSIRMANRSADELLSEFTGFFGSSRHSLVAPSSVYPKVYEGSYFVNAGMNQFKPLFLGSATAAQSSSPFDRLTRAVNCQPCIRVGGRHDDLNDVGYDGQHHTMFEMLGSWSFGDYYKPEACRLMWTFLREVLHLPANALYVTYFGGCPELGLPADNETRNIWLSLGVLDQKLMPFGVEHNFWRAGQSSGGGLCGAATEIHVDFEALCGDRNLRCARCLINTGNPHVVELWNCVFITHRLHPQGDGFSDKQLLEPLPRQFVDTGMGLERLAAVMQGVTSTYDSDRFQTLLDRVHAESTTSDYTPPEYGGHFLPMPDMSAPSNSPDELRDNSEPTEADDHLSIALSHRSVDHHHRGSGLLSTLWRRLAGDARQIYCPSGPPAARPPHLPVAHADDQSIANWHRDIAYRLLADHSRALALTLSDGLLPGRQGLGLKLRQLIQRATRAALLGGLDDVGCRAAGHQSVLASLVGHVAQQHRERVERLGQDGSVVRGPSAQAVSQLSPAEIATIVDREVKSFSPRVDCLEKAFHQCLQEPIDEAAHRLSDDQVRGLLTGRFGAQVSWDLICAQSRWAGLALPKAPSPNDTDPKAGGRPVTRTQSSGQKSTAYPLQFLASLLQRAGVPHSDDSRKLSVSRRQATDSQHTVHPRDLYDFPDCRSHLVGLLLPDRTSSEDPGPNYRLFSPESALPVHWSEEDHVGDIKLGLIFESTNFFTPSGGQDGDLGWIECCLPTSSITLAVDEVQLIPALALDSRSSPTSGWVVHWVVSLDSVGSGDVLTSLAGTLHRSGDPVYRLTVDKQRRFDLMSHHTGQHLFTWALSAVAADHLITRSADQTDSRAALVQHYGGAVHPDHFTLRVSLPDQLSVRLQDSPVDLVRQVEAKCRQAIASQLPVCPLQVTWDEVTKNPAIRRFAWNDYAHHVTAVCIGGRIPRAVGELDSVSAELCGGTHLLNTGDLEDLAVLSIRSRRQPVKQFSVLVGQAARECRQRGDQLLVATAASSPSGGGPTPLVVRELLSARDGLVAAREESDDSELITQQLQRRLRDQEASSSPVVIVPMTAGALSPMDRPLACLLQLAPSTPVIMHSGPLALCYFPPAWTPSALDAAHLLAGHLSAALTSQSLPLLVKARPFRASRLTDSNRYRFALLQLLLLPAASGRSELPRDWDQLPAGLLLREVAVVVDQLQRRQQLSGER